MKSEIMRETKETSVSLLLEYPGRGSEISCGCGFLSHMLTLLCHRAGLGLTLKASGDTDVDYHHLTEDVAIALGQALREIFRGGGNIARYGWCLLPMDGSLARVALDISGRGGLYFKDDFPAQKCGDFDMELVGEFFRALAREAGITLHLSLLEADNSHHAAEALFKGVGQSLKMALAPALEEASTKGVWL